MLAACFVRNLCKGKQGSQNRNLLEAFEKKTGVSHSPVRDPCFLFKREQTAQNKPHKTVCSLLKRKQGSRTRRGTHPALCPRSPLGSGPGGRAAVDELPGEPGEGARLRRRGQGRARGARRREEGAALARAKCFVRPTGPQTFLRRLGSCEVPFGGGHLRPPRWCCNCTVQGLFLDSTFRPLSLSL